MTKYADLLREKYPKAWQEFKDSGSAWFAVFDQLNGLMFYEASLWPIVEYFDLRGLHGTVQSSKHQASNESVWFFGIRKDYEQLTTWDGIQRASRGQATVALLSELFDIRENVLKDL